MIERAWTGHKICDPMYMCVDMVLSHERLLFVVGIIEPGHLLKDK